MIRTYKYRLYPGDQQAQALNNILWVGWNVYNDMLRHRRKRWAESRHSVRYYEQAGMWRDWRNEDPENNPMRLLNMSAGQQVLRRLDKAHREFFAGKRGKPRFKRFEHFNSLNYKPGDGASVKDGRLYVQNAGLIKVRWHRPLPEGGKLKNIILLRRNGRWHVCLQIELPDAQPEPHPGDAVGVDVGLLHALALSDGAFVDSPHHLQQSLKKLRVLQRTVARRKKGSNRWKKAVRQLAKQHEHIANQRRDFWNKVTRWLVNTYGLIALEDLNLHFMLRNGNLARAAHDTSLGIFKELLAYKAIEAGCKIVLVDPKYTSQMCSGCGEIVQKALHVRTHNCSQCGLVIDRDTNAAINILLAASPPGRGGQALTWAVGPSVA